MTSYCCLDSALDNNLGSLGFGRRCLERFFLAPGFGFIGCQHLQRSHYIVSAVGYRVQIA